ncbi:hypothetical protein Vadar_016084 [Vaccinium darrowii]|uniref:Uncharacterized protein n=1 Tax=Vaccinium darrowii TaxID=229202 RepID=A0ACB7XI10_9ERIC|nr:hypothetical protein Vadar_016084 [Vaccinium darrowii]
MDGQKRKRRDIDGEVGGKRTTTVIQGNGVKREEPGDDEVEEFFAILRRIRVAVEYFEKGGGKGGGRLRELTAMGPSSRKTPPFRRREYEEEIDGVKGLGEEVGDTGLDLNADPRSDSEHDVS